MTTQRTILSDFKTAFAHKSLKMYQETLKCIQQKSSSGVNNGSILKLF